jgi:hypothetical protein
MFTIPATSFIPKGSRACAIKRADAGVNCADAELICADAILWGRRHIQCAAAVFVFANPILSCVGTMF